MRFWVTSSGGVKPPKEHVELSTLEELTAWVVAAGHPVIITPPYSILNPDEWVLEIYDDYRE